MVDRFFSRLSAAGELARELRQAPPQERVHLQGLAAELAAEFRQLDESAAQEGDEEIRQTVLRARLSLYV